MAEQGEWTRKGAVLSDVTAQKEYGVTREFIVDAIRAGKLEYREGSVWGNPYFRIFRRQLEALLAERHGAGHVVGQKQRTELAKTIRAIAALKKQLMALEARKAELEAAIGAPAPKSDRRRSIAGTQAHRTT
jgi:hypothetical protein